MLGPPAKLLLKDSKEEDGEKSKVHSKKESHFMDEDDIQDDNFTVISKSHTKEG